MKDLYLLLLLTVAATFIIPSTSIDTINQATSITGNQKLVSAGGLYALGFFSPPGANDGRTYLGIWYANIPGPKTIVWVANRVDPVIHSPAVLQLSAVGRIVILDTNNKTIWSSPAPTRNVSAGSTAQLLDSGNFVLSSDGSGSAQSVAWQSFDYPTDTLLPGMKLGVDSRAGITRNITSWRSPSDPSPGDYTFMLVSGGLPQFFLVQRGTTTIYTSGPWNGDILTGVPYLKSMDFTFNVVDNRDETYYSYAIRDPSLLSRLVVVDDAEGQLRRFTLNNATWNNLWYYPTDQCDYYAKCGPFGYCNPDRSPSCSCLPGFEMRLPQRRWSLQDWSGGCVRRTDLSCDGGDGFVVVNQMKLPQATGATVHMGLNLDQCRQACLSNCSCRAYAAANMSGGVGVGCVIWTVDLLDMRQYPIIVQDVYIRLAQSEIDALSATTANRSEHRQRARKKMIVVIVTISGVVLLLAVVPFIFCWIRKARRKGHSDSASLLPSCVDVVLPSSSHPELNSIRDEHLDEEICVDVDLPLFNLEEILVATDNFTEHNKIGEGGFGPVYMGNLEDGQQIAVKRLSRESMQGIREFMNEVKLIVKLQHRNLVRLLGCCIDNDERILVYEYMDNQSLDTFIFEKRRFLEWQKQYDIILGIARGLQYLHEDSRFRIIHRDLKASNVLLDRNMVPKISDFGIARMFRGDQSTACTGKVIGTYGYMSPEYAMQGIISMKSDVFSFGVLVLEIVTGKRNQGSFEPELDVNLLGYAWMLWKEGRCLELLDEAISGSFHHGKVLRCIQVALLCVEAQPRNRPLMSSVVTMLASENPLLPEPYEPAVNIGMSMSGTGSSQTKSATTNTTTITALDAR